MQDMYEARAKQRRKLQKKEWECRERQKEYPRRLEKERNKEKEYKRKWEIMKQEDDIDGGDLKRREHKSSEERRRLEKKESEYTQRQKKYLQKLKKEEKKEEKYRQKPEGMKQEDDIDGGDLKRTKHKSSTSKERRRKLREKEEDSEDRLKEEEVAEKSDAGKDRSTHSHDRSSRRVRGRNDNETNRTRDDGRKDNYARSGVREQGFDKAKPPDTQKLLDAKHMSSVSKEEKPGAGKDRSRRSHDRSSPRVTGRNEGRKDNYAQSGVREQGVGKAKPPDNEKLLDANRISSASKEEKSDPGKDSSRSSHDRSSPRVTGRNDDVTNRGIDEGIKDNYARRGFREQGFDKAKPPDEHKLLDAKRVSSVSQEEKSDAGKDRSKRSYDRSSPRVTGRNDDETNCGRDEGRKDNYARSGVREQRVDKAKTPHNQKLLDLIDLIPMTKDGVFSYKINWAVYDKNKLHDQMRTQISKMIEKFLGKEDTPLVDFIVSSMREHVEASEMLKRIQSILDVEVEMFEVKIWRLLIFEIMKIETPDLSKT